MRIIAFAHQRFALRHAELVLLVNDDQAELRQIKAAVNSACVPMKWRMEN
jgi:hypothetical protein